MTEYDKRLAARLLRGRKNLEALKRAAVRPAAAAHARLKLAQLAFQQAELNRRVEKALMARGLDPNQVR